MATDSLTPEQAMEQALSHFQAGELQHALKLYQAVLEADPDHASANHNVGAIALKLERPGEALRYFNQALKQDPTNEQHWISLVQTLAYTGQKDLAQRMMIDASHYGLTAEAIERMEAVVNPRQVIREVQAGDPDELLLPEPDPATLSGPSAPEKRVAEIRKLLQKKRLNKALKLADTLMVQYPGDSRIYELKGRALFRQQAWEEAEKVLEAALSLEPNNADVAEVLANTCVKAHRYDRAIAAYRRVRALDPERHRVLVPWADALYACSRFEEAVENCDKAIAAPVDVIKARLIAGRSRKIQHRYQEAEHYFQDALQGNTGDAEIYHELGKLHGVRGHFEQALDCFGKACDLKPDNQVMVLDHAYAQYCGGRRDEAIENVCAFIERFPDNARAYIHLQDMGALQSGTEWASALEQLAHSDAATHHNRTLAHFVLGNMRLSDDQDDEKAFEAFHQANRLESQYRRQSPGVNQLASGVIDRFDRRYFNIRRTMGHESAQPLFISGMPRSGKSLAEKLLGCSPELAAAKELPWLNRMVPGAGSIKELMTLSGSITQRQLTSNAEFILNALRSATRTDARYISETSPKNLAMYYFAQMFPQAPVIFFDRDPWDLLATIYFKYFANGHDYSFDIARLEQQIVAEKRLMAHWLEVLPNPCIKMTYEELVSDPVVAGRRMADFLDIEWHDDYAAKLHISEDTDSLVEMANPINSIEFSAKAVPLTNEFIGFGERFREFFLPHIPCDTPFAPPES